MGDLKGFHDKLYWRQPHPPDGPFHCFKRMAGGGYQSLCGNYQRDRSGGQAVERPPPMLRCGRCDGKEMDRRGWDESGPTTRMPQ